MTPDPGPTPTQAVVTVVDANVAATINGLRELVDTKTDSIREVVDAKMEGLQDLVRAESSSTREMIAPYANVPADVAALKAERDALSERVDGTATKDEYDALVQRVADLESHRTLSLTWKAMLFISLATTFLGAVVSHLANL